MRAPLACHPEIGREGRPATLATASARPS
jgi:hypothetical protein